MNPSDEGQPRTPEDGGTVSFPNPGAPASDGRTVSVHLPADQDATRLRPSDDPDATRTPGTSADGSATAPRAFGDYEIVGQIARGGMGVVYRARQLSLSRDVAVKMILAGQLATETEVHRFRAEAEAAAGLDHPHILPIYEIGEHDGHHFFSMKLVGGGSLAALLKQSPRPPLRELVQLHVAVCRAVHFAHQHGILHRDLKPANILLASAESKSVEATPSDSALRAPGSAFHPYVTDFGLARRVEGNDTGVTRTGSVLGTPAYMAPEQARADKNPTTAVDVYSLGAILFEIVTDRPPFQAESAMETLLRVMRDEPPHPSSIVSGADRDLSVIALKCLEKDPARRYESAAGLADELERWLRSEPILARPATRAERAVKWVRRNPAVAALIAFAVVLLLTGTAVSTYFAITADRRADDAIRAKKESDDNAERADRSAREATQYAALAAQRERDGRQRLARTSVINGNRLLDSRDWAGALLWYVEALKLDHDDPERDEQHRRRVGLFLRHIPRLVAAWELPEDESVVGSDRERILTTRDKTARLWDARTGKPVGAPMTADRTLNESQLSPDGKRLLAIGIEEVNGKHTSEVRLWDVPACRPASPALVLDRGVNIGCFLPDRGGIVLLAQPPDASGNSELALWDGVAAKPVFVQSPDGPVRGARVAVSRDGKRAAVVTMSLVNGAREHDTVTLFDRAGEKWVPRAEIDAGGFLSGDDFGFDDTGARAWVAASGSGRVSVYSPGDGAAKPFELNVDGLREVTLSPDARHLFVAAESGLRRIDFHDGPSSVFLGPGSASVPQVAPDGMLVATWLDTDTGKNLRVWRNAAAQVPVGVLHHNEQVILSDFMPDARHFVTVQSDGLVRVWDLAVSGPDTVVPVADEVIAISAQTDRLFVRDGSTVVIRALSTGQRIGAPLDCRGQVNELFVGADGRYLLARTHTGASIVWNLATGAAVPVPLRAGASVQFSRDGSRLGTVGGEPFTIAVFDSATGKPVGPELAPPEGAVLATFDPDCRFVVTAVQNSDGATSLPRVWATATGAEVKFDPPLPPGTNQQDLALGARLFAKHPDGQQVAAWELPTGRLLWKAPVRLSYIFQLTDTGTGRVLTHNGLRGTTVLFDADTGARVGEFRSAATGYNPLLLPDGRRLVLYSTSPPLRVIDTHTARPLGPGFGSLDMAGWTALRADDRVMAVGSAVWDPLSGDPLSPARWFGPESTSTIDGFRPDGALVESWSRRSSVLAKVAGRLVTVRSSEAVYTGTDLAPDRRPAEALLLLAEVLSGRRIDETGSVVDLTPEELIARLAQVPRAERAPAELVRWHHRMSWTDERFGEVFHLDALLRLEPNNPDWRARRAARHLETGDRVAALAQLDRAAALGADGADYWTLRGWAEVDGKDWSKSEAAFTKLVERAPLSPDAWEARATARARARKWSAAGADLLKYSETLGSDPAILSDSTRARWAGLLALHAGGDPEPYRKLWKELLAKDVDRVNRPVYVPWVCAVPGVIADYEPLAAFAKGALDAAAGTDAEAIVARNYGALAYRAGQFADARKALERAYKLDKLDPDVRAYLALARYQAGDTRGGDAVLKELTDAIQTDSPPVADWVRLELLRAEAAALATKQK